MVRIHFLIIWDIETNKEFYSERTKGGEWEGLLLFFIGEIYKFGLQHRLEVIHIGHYNQSKTFRKDDIEEIGPSVLKVQDEMKTEVY